MVGPSSNFETSRTALDELSKVTAELRQQAAFYNQAYLSESSRLLDDLSTNLRRRFQQIASHYRERWLVQLAFFQKFIT